MGDKRETLKADLLRRSGEGWLLLFLHMELAKNQREFGVKDPPPKTRESLSNDIWRAYDAVDAPGKSDDGPSVTGSFGRADMDVIRHVRPPFSETIGRPRRGPVCAACPP